MSANVAEERAPKFDLVALESTRAGMKLLGPGLALALLGPALETLGRPGVWAGGAVHVVSFALVGVAVLGMAGTPNGPLPGFVRWIYALLCLASVVLTVGRLAVHAGVDLSPSFAPVVRGVVNATQAALLLLFWILWRFCQHRGLTGRALGWLWIAVATTVTVAAVLAGLDGPAWFLVLIGGVVVAAARRTANEVWVDAINRNSKLVVADMGERPEAQPLSDPSVR